MPFKFIPLSIPEVILVEPTVYGDSRGFFMENFRENEFAEGGVKGPFVQDNHSKSKKGVLRGLHFQIPPKGLGKLVRVTSGAAFDVAVDLRSTSKTFGKWVGATLTAENKSMLFVPNGFAHGFLSLKDDTEFLYKMTGYYAPEFEKGLAFDDSDIGIKWPEMDEYFLSEKDKSNISFKDYSKTPDF